MSHINSILDRLSSLLIDPSNHNRSSSEKAIAWVTTIIVGVGTLGAAQGLSALWRKLRHIKENDTQKKIAQLIQGIFNKNNQIDELGEATHLFQSEMPSTASLPPPTLQVIANQVYKNRLELWTKAKRQANSNDQYEIIKYFIHEIRQEFKKNDLSLSEISNDPEALNQWFQSSLLSPAVVLYAKINDIKTILDPHLIFLTNKIVENRNALYIKAKEVAGNDITAQLFAITEYVRILFKSEGRSLSEVLKNQKAFEIFTKSNGLKIALRLYLRLITQENPSKEKQEAIDLALLHAPGEGFITQLNLKEFVDDPKKLKKAVFQFLMKNHPDKLAQAGVDPDSNLEQVKAAHQIKDFIDNGVLRDYLAVIKKVRNQGTEMPFHFRNQPRNNLIDY